MRWIDRGRKERELSLDVVFAVVVIVAGVVLIIAMNLVALKSALGQEFYVTPDGVGMINEITPGVRYYSGPYSGMSVELYPGITRFEIEAPDGQWLEGTRYELGTRTDRERPSPHAPAVEADQQRPWWERP